MAPLRSQTSVMPGRAPASAARQLQASAVALAEAGEDATLVFALLRAALTMEPRYAEGWLELGNAHLQHGHYHHAISAYRQALVLDGSLREAHANLALACLELGQLDGAIAACRAGLAVDPDDRATRVDLLRLLRERRCAGSTPAARAS